MSEILGKVTTASHVIPRGADVSLRISVPPRWLDEGRTIEVELPRNLTCAKCGGGGCSACGNAGAITLRSRNELPELVQVVLPLSSLVDGSSTAVDEPPSQRANVATNPDSAPRSDKRPVGQKPIVIRVPECGGLPDASKGEIIRGWLLLQVDSVGEVSPNVSTLDDDAIDSSKLLRAVVRSSGKSATGPSFKAVVLPRRSRSAPAAADEPNASRVTSAPARARSNAPKTQPPVAVAQRLDSAPSRRRTWSLSAVRVFYVGLAVLVGVLAALLLYRLM